MMKFMKRKKHKETVEEKSDGIVITDTMRLYLIRQAQDRQILGTVLLSESQFNMLIDALNGKGIIFTRD